MNLQLVYWYILSLSKNENMFFKKNKAKQNKTTKKRKEKKFPSGGSRISKQTNKNNSCTQFAREGVGRRPIYNSYVKERKMFTKNLLKRF